MLPSNMLVLILILPIVVTFSTPTADFTQVPAPREDERNRDVSPIEISITIVISHRLPDSYTML